jgi:NADH-quinone oxidoreductase subunit C
MAEASAQGTPQPAAALSEKSKALLAIVQEELRGLPIEVSVAGDLVSARVTRECLVEFCRKAKDSPKLDFKCLLCISVVDYKESFQVVYHLLSVQMGHRMVVKVDLPYDAPKVPSVTSVWKGADWHEREGADLFGVDFENHPDPRPLLLWEGFEGHPMRKDYPLYDYQEW